jgi:hypothetical protein
MHLDTPLDGYSLSRMARTPQPFDGPRSPAGGTCEVGRGGAQRHTWKSPSRSRGVGERLAEVERKRSAYQDQQAEGLITLDELRSKLAILKETRDAARRELSTLKERRERIEHLEHDANALLEHYASMVPEALDDLTAEERHRIYKMMRLNVTMYADGLAEVTGAFSGLLNTRGEIFVKSGRTLSSTATSRTSPWPAPGSTSLAWR